MILGRGVHWFWRLTIFPRKLRVFPRNETKAPLPIGLGAFLRLCVGRLVYICHCSANSLSKGFCGVLWAYRDVLPVPRVPIPLLMGTYIPDSW
jgi:hypothetical protein